MIFIRNKSKSSHYEANNAKIMATTFSQTDNKLNALGLHSYS